MMLPKRRSLQPPLGTARLIGRESRLLAGAPSTNIAHMDADAVALKRGRVGTIMACTPTRRSGRSGWSGRGEGVARLPTYFKC
jgi:hypothetical protein